MAKNKKPKHEAVGQIDYVWNLALFARQFEVEVDAPPEIIVKSFQDITQKQRGFFIPKERTVDINAIIPNESYTFDLRIKHADGNPKLTTVKTVGKIIYSQGYEKTIIRGDIRIGWVYALALLGSPIVGWFIVPIWSNTDSLPLPMMLFAMIYIGFLLSQVRRDYKVLTTQIQDKINDAQQSHAETIELNLQTHADNESASNDYYESAQE